MLAAGFDELVEELVELDEELVVLDDESLEPLEPDDPLDPVEPDEPDDSDDPDAELLLFPRWSVLKKPLPLNVTPTGWKTFLTDINSPVAGCAYSVSVSSVNDCWTSIVSSVSMNL
ncbi:MAG: hypothetical protein ACE37B_07970 [Ilumatobacter sp.]|uniref:hypothetical protein n=1 Tax=Ilumatobacter sp. TaxID=1967498 RepID=UPI00391C09F6